jgi:hypothetical protein
VTAILGISALYHDIVLLLLGFIITLGPTLTPFIYSLF